MSTATRPYIVTHTASGQRRLVTATTAGASRVTLTRGERAVNWAAAAGAIAAALAIVLTTQGPLP